MTNAQPAQDCGTGRWEVHFQGVCPWGPQQKDLVPLLGGRNRVSEVPAGKRPLTVAAIRALSDALDIPADLLVREPEAAPYRVKPKRRARRPAGAQRKLAART